MTRPCLVTHASRDLAVRGLEKLAAAGLTLEHWEALISADPTAVQALVSAWPSPGNGLVYDAPHILGLGAPASLPLPAAVAAHEIVLRVGHWSLMDLLASTHIAAQQLIIHDQWMCLPSWAEQKLTEGTYRLMLRVPGSRLRSYPDQRASLRSQQHETAAPVALVVAALACAIIKREDTPLGTDTCLCAEHDSKDYPGLSVRRGRVHLVRMRWFIGHPRVWLAGCHPA